MSPITNGRVLFKEIPEGFPEPGRHVVYDESQKIDINNVPLNGGYLLKTLELSVDPYLRGRMRDAKISSYQPAFTVGQPLEGHGIGVVVRSESDLVKPGDHIHGIIQHQNYLVREDLEMLEIVQNPYNLHWSTFLGVLGMPGKTAFFGWKEYSKAEKGQTVFVSTGGGPVGSLVIQLAKRDGLKVIASAGQDHKVKFMKAIGADVAFNYKTTNTAEVLAKEGPIDLYWDNVGGETLDAALDAIKINGRIIECGMISGYNVVDGAAVKNLFEVIAKSLTIHGFVVFRLEEKHGKQFWSAIPPLVASGEIKHQEEIYIGMDKVADAILAVQKGQNKAKAVIHVADD